VRTGAGKLMSTNLTKKIKLLLVEDDPNIGSALERSCLETYNYTIVTSIAEAKKKLTTEKFDIAILNYHLGDGTSQELFALLQAKNCPFIIVVESGQEEIVADLVNQGAEDYLIKDTQYNYIKVLPVTVKKVLSYRQQLSTLRENELFLGTMLDSSNIGLVIVDNKGKFIETNRYYQKLVGYSQQELKSMTFLDITVEEDQEENVRLFREALENQEKGYSLEKRYRHRRGHILWVYVTAYNIYNKLGELRLAVSIIKDITEKKQAELSLETSEKKFFTIFQASPDSIAISKLVNGQYRLTDFNKSFSKITGYSYAEAIGKNSEELNFWVDPDTKNQIWQTLEKEKSFQNLECQLRQKSGKIITILLSAEMFAFNEETYVMTMSKDISHRKRLEEALKASAAELENLINSMQDYIYVLNREGRYLKGSSSNSQVINNLNNKFSEHWPQDVADYFLDIIGTVLDTGQATQQEYCVPIQGVWTWFSANISPLNTDAVLWVARNITKLKTAEESLIQLNQQLELIIEDRTAELIESQKRYQLIFNSKLDAVFVHHLTKNGYQEKFSEVNDAACQMLGYSRAELLEKTPQDITIWRSLSHTEIITQLKNTDQSIFESKILTKNGQIIPTELNINALKSGEEKTIIAFVRDITDRKQAEEALLESRKFLQTVLDHFPFYVFWKDHNSVFLGCNLKFAQVAGTSLPAEIIGKTDYDLPWSLEKTKRYLAEDRQVLESGQSLLEIIKTEVQPDGSIIWLETNKFPLYNTKNEIIGILGIVEDISNRKNDEARLRETNQKLARATRLKDEFLANMSHELRTPLNAILGMTEALEKHTFGTINEQQEGALETIEQSGRHLLELITDILDVAKIEAGQVEMNFTTTNINHLCQSSLNFIKQLALQKNIQTTVNISSDLLYLLVDERRMRQVLINLLNNAVKFTPENGRITLEVTKIEPDRVEIAIKDTGIGIAAENLEKIFEPFIQIDSKLNRQYDGTGLGLALVKKLVELQGGQITVSSKLGIGSCFTVSIPFNAKLLIAKNQTTCPSEFSPALDFFKPNNSVNKYLVLLAEDNEANIVTISSYLKAKGYRIIIAKNGSQAIEITKKEKPNLILMDLQMQEVSGLEAIEKIRSDPQLLRIPIIALTALAMQGDREKALELGANEYLTKPVQLSQLAIKIQQLLRLEENI